MNGIMVDIGCGASKRDGYLGVDCIAQPGVDYVLDITAAPLPFEDNSVSSVYSAHVLEHIGVPNFVLSEIGRVCQDGAKIEIITPYAFSNDAFVYGHVTFMTELPWMHFCVSHRDAHFEMLRGRWQFDALNFVIPEWVAADLRAQNVPIDFAVKYYKGVVEEFGVEMTYRTDPAAEILRPVRSYSLTRLGPRTVLPPA